MANNDLGKILTHAQKGSWALLLLLYTAFIIYGCLSPFSGWLYSVHNYYTPLVNNAFTHIFAFDVVQNLLLYIPFGTFFILWVAPKSVINKLGWIIGLALVSLAMALALEFLQVHNPQRFPSLLDVALNVISALIGGLFALLAEQLLNRFLSKLTNDWTVAFWPFSWKAWLSVLILLAWVSLELFPFLPTLHPKVLQESIAPLLQGITTLQKLDLEPLFFYWIQGCILYVACWNLFRIKPYLSVFPMIFLILSLKILMIGRILIQEELYGLVFGALLSQTITWGTTYLFKKAPQLLYKK